MCWDWRYCCLNFYFSVGLILCAESPAKPTHFERVPNTKIDRHVQINMPETHSLCQPSSTPPKTPALPQKLHITYPFLSAMVALVLSSSSLSLCNFVLLFIAPSVWISNYMNAKLSILMMGTPWLDKLAYGRNYSILQQ